MEFFELTNQNIYDMTLLSRYVNEFNKHFRTLKALLTGRRFLFTNMHRQYPNMSASAITTRLWEQECTIAGNVEYDLQNIRIGFANFACEIGTISDKYDVITNVITLLKEEGVDVCNFSSLTF